ncbi:MAG: cyanophycinase [Planctomycetota bacterium]|nr:cyanophycinase [Planctomycetota bacterium]
MRPLCSRILLLLLVAVAWRLVGDSAVWGQAPESPSRTPDPQGTLVIVGGGLRFDNVDVWSRIVKSAHDYAVATGESKEIRPRIAVFPTAAYYPQVSGSRSIAALNKYGADAFLVPIAIQNAPVDVHEAVRDPAVVAQIRSAHGVFFTGGQQARIMQALLTSEGEQTPALRAVWHVYNAGGVIAGTSAGAAVMSQIMCRSVESQLRVLEQGITLGKETAPGLGFLDAKWFVDQHFIIRGRFARALVVTQHHQVPHGLGIDENTALVVQGDQTEIVGYRGAIFLDLSKSAGDPKAVGFFVKNARVSYLDRGDILNMRTLELTPAPEKQTETVIDPSSSNFQPEGEDALFTTEILSNSTLLDMMRRLLHNKHREATGLAFDASAARNGPVPAFEFRMTLDNDTRAWPPGTGEDYTISNVRLDVRRVEFAGLSYK